VLHSVTGPYRDTGKPFFKVKYVNTCQQFLSNLFQNLVLKLTEVMMLRITGIFGLCPLSGILETRNTFRKKILFPSSGEGEVPANLGALERAKLLTLSKGPNRVGFT
jgi:hypothetical protein